jgi:hypothetical protein
LHRNEAFGFALFLLLFLEGVRSASMISYAVVSVASSFLPLAFAFDFLLLLH